MIIPVYKPLGASSHALAAAIGRAKNEKATHTGTLDPMAEGVLVVLTGEDRFRKSELSNTQKTYTFQMVFGVCTDTHDLLGIPEKISKQKKEPALPLSEISDKVATVLQQFSGEMQQVQPLFSAGRVGGKSFFEYGKQKQEIDLPKNTVTFLSSNLDAIKEIDLHTLQHYLLETIPTVQGDFRQEEILASWEQTIQQLANDEITALPLVTITITVTKRTYIRALVRDISTEIAIPATTFSIVRTKNGPYTIQDCVSNLVETNSLV